MSGGSLLSSVVLSKIPQEIRLIISREIGDGDRKLDHLMKILLSELRARERATVSDIPSVKGRERIGRPHSTAAALLTGGKGTTPTCYYCQQVHLSHTCKNVVTVEERKRIIRETGRCFVCLRKGHIFCQCTSKSRCPHCYGRHHGSICSGQKPAKGYVKPKDPDGTAPTMTNLATGMKPTATTFQPSAFTTLWTGGSQAILLQTAQATGFNPTSPDKSCRQRSYVTERVARSLSLPTEGEKSPKVMRLGSSRQQPRVCELVRLGLASKDGTTKQLTLFAVSMICEPIACQPISLCRADFDHLTRIDVYWQ